MSANIHALDTFQLNPVVINLAIGLPGLGLDIPTDGFYTATISDVAVSTSGTGGPSIALTLNGIGNGVRYHYLQLPQLGADGQPPTEDKAARSYKGAVKGIIGTFVAAGILTEEFVAGGQTVQIEKGHFAQLKGRQIPVHYFAPLPDAVDPSKVDFSTEEILILTPSMKAEADADPSKIKRWKKAKSALTSPGQLGIAVGAGGVGVGVGAGALPAFGAQAPQQGLPTLPTAPGAVQVQQPAAVGAVGMPVPGGFPTAAPTLPGAQNLPAGLAALAGPPR